MTTAICVGVTEAVKDLLNEAPSGTFNHSFTACRTYAEHDLELTGEDAEKVHVDVAFVINKQDADLALRGEEVLGVPVDVCVRYKFKQSEKQDSTGRVRIAEIDRLVLLVEQIKSYLIAQSSEWESDAAEWINTEILVLPNRAMLRKQQFEAIVRTTFRAYKATG